MCIRDSNDVIEPIYDWSPCVGVSDIAYYEHDAIPEWQGKLLVTVLGGVGFDRAPRISVMTFNENGTEIVSEELFFEDFGRIRDVAINPHTGSIYFATNGDFYPGDGPNEIVEYKNEDFIDSVNETVLSSQNIKVYPNPARDIINVESSSQLLGTDYEIISYAGEIVKTGLINAINQEITINDLAHGQYFIRCKNEGGLLTRTFTVVR